MASHPILSWQIVPEVIQISTGDVHIDAASIAVLMLPIALHQVAKVSSDNRTDPQIDIKNDPLVRVGYLLQETA